MASNTKPSYELLYWPVIPGRGEFIRLVFEATHTPYTDPSNASKEGIFSLLAVKDTALTRDPDDNPPIFAPPALRIHGGGKDGKPLLISQTPAILAYLGDKLGLAGSDEAEKFWVMSLASTALDLNDAAHDTHHPVDLALYYEDQKEEALRKSKGFRTVRIPMLFGYFERVLKGNEAGQGKFLVGDKLSYADTTLWHVLSGLKYAFPKELEVREKEFALLFGTFYESVKETKGIKDYLASDRRLTFNLSGIYRQYPELDRQN